MMALRRCQIDASPKRRIPRIHEPPAFPIAHPYSNDASDHNYAKSCARHDFSGNPSASRAGRPKYHHCQRGGQYDNSGCESHS